MFEKRPDGPPFTRRLDTAGARLRQCDPSPPQPHETASGDGNPLASGRCFAPFAALVYSHGLVRWFSPVRAFHILIKAFPRKTMSEPDRLSAAAPQGRLTLALYQPDIPQNTGTMLRTCACLGVDAAIIEPAGFPVTDKNFRRAGMDYLDHVPIDRHASFAAFEAWRAQSGRRLVLLTTKGAIDYRDFAYQRGDILLVGRESAGVPDGVHDVADARVIIPIRPGFRSLNVAVAGTMVLGEALRQLGKEEE